MLQTELTRKSHTDILRTSNATVGLMAKILTFSGHDFDLLRPDDTAWSIRDNALAIFEPWKRSGARRDGEALIRRPARVGRLGDRR